MNFRQNEDLLNNIHEKNDIATSFLFGYNSDIILHDEYISNLYDLFIFLENLNNEITANLLTLAYEDVEHLHIAVETIALDPDIFEGFENCFFLYQMESIVDNALMLEQALSAKAG